MTSDETALEGALACVGDYLNGMIRAEPDRLRQSFHPAALIVGHMNGVFTTETVAQFVDAVVTTSGITGGAVLPARIISTDVEGLSASIKVENVFAGMRYTDYLSLLKVEGRWMIVHKTYHEWERV